MASKSLREKVLGRKRKPGELTQRQWEKTPQGQAELEKFARRIERVRDRMRDRNRAVGYGDGEIHRVLLEMREATGLDIDSLGEMPTAEFQKVAMAILRKREADAKRKSDHEVLVEPLIANDVAILDVMRRMKADANSPISAEIILSKLNRQIDDKRAFNNLKKMRYVSAKKGPGGGYFLTPAGMERAKTLE